MQKLPLLENCPYSFRILQRASLLRSKNGTQDSTFCKPPAQQVNKAKNGSKGKRKNWESLPVDFAVKDQREVRRYSNISPRLRKGRSNSRNDFQDNRRSKKKV